MEETYTLAMSLMDYLPPLAFLIGLFFLVRLAQHLHVPNHRVYLIPGGILVCLGGFF